MNIVTYKKSLSLFCVLIFAFSLSACSQPATSLEVPAAKLDSAELVQTEKTAEPDEAPSASSEQVILTEEETKDGTAEKNKSLPNISIVEDYRSSFVHGNKDATHQKYIVLHDTEGNSDPASVINSWDNNGNLVASHFIVGKDGTIYQCVPLDKIAHHAGYGDTGHNAAYGISEDGRDDMAGSVWVGNWASDYGMNAWSVGIEMVHVGGSGYYPDAQLEALDTLIAYIDAYYGFESTIIDHKAWRSGNSDTSPEFAGYLANYQSTRHH